MAMDKECIKICEALNLLPGITTTESCCGHEKTEYHIYFESTLEVGLYLLLQFFPRTQITPFLSTPVEWDIKINTGRPGGGRLTYLLTGPIGEIAYEEAEEIAEGITKFIADNKEFVDIYYSVVNDVLDMLSNRIMNF